MYALPPKPVYKALPIRPMHERNPRLYRDLLALDMQMDRIERALAKIDAKKKA